jgi:predicted DNA-binding protein
MNKITLSTRVDPEWYKQITSVMETTGQTQSEVLTEAIGSYLGKVAKAKITSRLGELEADVANLRGLVLEVANEVYQTSSV